MSDIDNVKPLQEASYLRNVMESAGYGLWEYIPATRQIYFSPQFQRLFGFSGEQKIGADAILELIEPKYRASLTAAMLEVLQPASSGIYDEEYAITNPRTRQQRMIKVYGKTFFNDNNVAERTVGFAEDITEQKSDEEKIARLAAIVESSYDAIVSKTLDGNITSWNQAAEKMFGYTAKEIIGKHITTLIPEERLDEETVIIELIRQGKRVDSFETKRITKDRKLLDVSLTISPIKNEKGEIIGASKIARNITPQREAELMLRKEEALFRMAVESTGLGSWEYQLDTNKFLWSAECYKIWGIPTNTDLNFNFLVPFIHAADLEQVVTQGNAALTMHNDGEFNVLFRIYHFATKDIRWIRGKGKVIMGENNQPEKLIGTMLDITAEMRVKEELERTVNERTRELTTVNEQLIKTNQELEQFVFVASHDLQEPLRKIQVFANLILKSQPLHDESKDYFQRMIAAANRMKKLITDLLDFSHIDLKKENFAQVDLDQELQEVLAAFKEIIDEEHIMIEAEKLPVIQGIAGQCNQLLMNIISNAIKYRKKEEPLRIKITCRQVNAKNADVFLPHREMNYWKISMEDNGIGFEQEFSEKIFEIFQRLHGKTEYEGTGVGLAICKRIVENHDGLITATGKPDFGAIFDIYVPAN